MQKFLILLVVVVLIFVLFFYFSQTNKIKKICINNFCFNVELAKNPLQQTRGLMFRKNLPEDRGMLFMFNKESIYPFWMKNTYIPLDIIWIKKIDNNGSGKIVFIAENVQPCTESVCPQIIPTEKASYVLEINAGLVSKLNIKVDQVLGGIDTDLKIE